MMMMMMFFAGCTKSSFLKALLQYRIHSMMAESYTWWIGFHVHWTDLNESWKFIWHRFLFIYCQTFFACACVCACERFLHLFPCRRVPLAIGCLDFTSPPFIFFLSEKKISVWILRWKFISLIAWLHHAIMAACVLVANRNVSTIFVWILFWAQFYRGLSIIKRFIYNECTMK